LPGCGGAATDGSGISCSALKPFAALAARPQSTDASAPLGDARRQDLADPLGLPPGGLRDRGRALDDEIEVTEVALDSGGAPLDDSRLGDPVKGGSQAAHDLDGRHPILSNLVECQSQIVFPGWHREDQAKRPGGVPGVTGIEFASAETP
jgi:hypothetical protein